MGRIYINNKNQKGGAASFICAPRASDGMEPIDRALPVRRRTAESSRELRSDTGETGRVSRVGTSI